MPNEQPHAGTPNPHDPNTFAEASATFTLHPLVALVLFGLDHMLGALELVSFGWLFFLSFLFGILVIGPVAVIQRRAYGDDRLLAVAKGCIVGLLLAVPSPLGSYLTGMWGIATFLAKKSGTRKPDVINTNGFEVK